MKISIGYPSAEEEIDIIRARRHTNPLDSVKAVTDTETIRPLKEAAADVYMDDAIYDYIVRLIGATRKHSALALGASPRASLAMSRMTQAYALVEYNGRTCPLNTPSLDFVRKLTGKTSFRSLTAEQVLRDILRAAEVPFVGQGTRGRADAEASSDGSANESGSPRS